MTDAKLRVAITADDGTKKGVDAAGKRFSQLSKSASKIGKDVSGPKRFSQQVAAMERETAKLFGRKSVMSSAGDRFGVVRHVADTFSAAKEEAGGAAGIGELGGALRLATSGLGLFAGAVVAAGAAAFSFVNKWALTGADLGRLSQKSGVSTEDLAAAGELGRRYGVTKEQGQQTAAALARRLNDAPLGRDYEMSALLNQFHIAVRRDASGNPDVVKAMGDISQVLSGIKDAPTRAVVAEKFGVDPLLPALVDGKAHFDTEFADVKKNTPTFLQAEAEQGMRVQHKETEVTQRVERVANRASAAGGGVLEAGADQALKLEAGAPGALAAAGGVVARAAGAVGHALDDGAHVVEHGFGKVGETLKSVVTALTKAAHDAGLDVHEVLTMSRIESHFNPNAHAGSSSAKGVLQFTKGTASQYGLKDPTDVVASVFALSRKERAELPTLQRKMGHRATHWESYLLHQQGLAGAIKTLTGDQSRRAVDVLGHVQVDKNGGNEEMTLADFARLWERRYAEADAANARQGVYKIADAVQPGSTSGQSSLRAAGAAPAPGPASDPSSPPARVESFRAAGAAPAPGPASDPSSPPARAEVTIKFAGAPVGTVTSVTSAPDVKVNVQRAMSGG